MQSTDQDYSITRQGISSILKFDYFMLLLVMALAFYVAFIPNSGYPYPVHIDEWSNWAYSSAIVEEGSIIVKDPFLGESWLDLSSISLSDLGYYFEVGYLAFWGIFQRISNIPWIVIIRYFPSIILMMTALTVYIMGRRLGFGWEAAFFAGLIPTTVGILGPAFFVPVAMGLLFIPLSIFVAFNFRGLKSYIVLFIFTTALLLIHAVTAIGLIIVLIPYIMISLKSEFWHALGVALALLIPCLAPFLVVPDQMLVMAREMFSYNPLPEYVDYPRIIKAYGYLPVAFCLLGIFILAWRGGRNNYSLILGLLLLLIIMAIFFTFNYGMPRVYDRGLFWLMFMMSIVAGTGLMAVKRIKLPEGIASGLRMPLITQNLGNILSLIVVGIVLFLVIPARQDMPYYHMIDTQDYAAFVWIRDNVGGEYDKAILDPWKATAFTAITGKYVYTRIHAYPKPSDEEARKFLDDGCIDTDFLKQNEISVVYSQGECNNPELIEVREGVYLFNIVAKTSSGS
jgi:hypothetical protein